LDETLSAVGPATLYAQCKDGFRRWAQEFASDSGLTFGWARIFFPIGLDEPPERLVASVARHLVASTPAPCSSGQGLRDFLDVRDTGAAIAAIALKEGSGIYNVGSGRGIAVAEVARRLGQLAGKPDLVKIGALPDRPDDPPSLVARIDRLATTGFRPAHALDSTLADTLAWWRDHP
jgi:nucleoside-diphosphate-sugar epimerase